MRTEQLPGVAGMACMESVRGESWEIQVGSSCLEGMIIKRPSVGPALSGKPGEVLALGARMSHREVGTDSSSHDREDNITSRERRVRTFGTSVRETRVDTVPRRV